MMKNSFGFVLIVLALVGCNNKVNKLKSNQCYDSTLNKSIVQVSLSDTKTLRSLQGSFIKIKGIFQYHFEDVALYPSITASPSTAVWINFARGTNLNDSFLTVRQGRPLIVVGKINMTDQGHSGMYIGSLDSAFCLCTD